MTPQKVRQLVLAAYFVPILCIIGQVYLTSRIPLSRYTLHRITCDHLSLFNLWCGDGFQSHVANVYGMCLVFFSFFSASASDFVVLYQNYGGHFEDLRKS